MLRVPVISIYEKVLKSGVQRALGNGKSGEMLIAAYLIHDVRRPRGQISVLLTPSFF
jgi:hypothetical protein